MTNTSKLLLQAEQFLENFFFVKLAEFAKERPPVSEALKDLEKSISGLPLSSADDKLAAERALNKAFRKLTGLYHPDSQGVATTPDEKEILNTEFKQINSFKDTLVKRIQSGGVDYSPFSNYSYKPQNQPSQKPEPKPFELILMEDFKVSQRVEKSNIENVIAEIDRFIALRERKADQHRDFSLMIYGDFGDSLIGTVLYSSYSREWKLYPDDVSLGSTSWDEAKSELLSTFSGYTGKGDSQQYKPNSGSQSETSKTKNEGSYSNSKTESSVDENNSSVDLSGTFILDAYNIILTFKRGHDIAQKTNSKQYRVDNVEEAIAIMDDVVNNASKNRIDFKFIPDVPSKKFEHTFWGTVTNHNGAWNFYEDSFGSHASPIMSMNYEYFKKELLKIFGNQKKQANDWQVAVSLIKTAGNLK